jgi:DNA-binding CsgD family transcriptional regulator
MEQKVTVLKFDGKINDGNERFRQPSNTILSMAVDSHEESPVVIIFARSEVSDSLLRSLPWLAVGVEDFGEQAKTVHAARLTAREVEVLRLVAQGLTDVQVAEQLIISPRTVNFHLCSIYSKIGVSLSPFGEFPDFWLEVACFYADFCVDAH